VEIEVRVPNVGNNVIKNLAQKQSVDSTETRERCDINKTINNEATEYIRNA